MDELERIEQTLRSETQIPAPEPAQEAFGQPDAGPESEEMLHRAGVRVYKAE